VIFLIWWLLSWRSAVMIGCFEEGPRITEYLLRQRGVSYYIIITTEKKNSCCRMFVDTR